MTGYHLTSLGNWHKIKKQGMIPYLITNPQIEHWVGQIEGIWLWTRKPEEKDLLFRILYQAVIKKSFKVVLMKVNYEKSDIYKMKHGRKMRIYGHVIELGNWQYEEKYGNAVILGKKVPPESIELLRTFNIMKVIR